MDGLNLALMVDLSGGTNGRMAEKVKMFLSAAPHARIDPVWDKAGELGTPALIHTGELAPFDRSLFPAS
jgi:hypothetical protein